MIPSDNYFKLLEESEGFKSRPYKCPAGIPTIGFGSTRYENGALVTMTDAPITKDRAKELAIHHSSNDIKGLLKLLKVTLNQNQFDAVLDFIYNLGLTSLSNSTLLKKININPFDKTIRDEFMKWDKARVNGELKRLPGLTIRRIKEADLYEKA